MAFAEKGGKGEKEECEGWGQLKWKDEGNEGRRGVGVIWDYFFYYFFFPYVGVKLPWEGGGNKQLQWSV